MLRALEPVDVGLLLFFALGPDGDHRQLTAAWTTLLATDVGLAGAS